ncbi:TetR/AcrR family transcriptional regulator [Streptomyces canus]|uniref:TetR/AcrR family transcriptional regulator n=1 Tax=Streptomyces canus TaxID=58343 RepID=UPI003714726A
MSATEKRITAAAIRLFAERDKPDLTMSELASEAQVARGTLYQKVDSTEQLFTTVLENMTRELHAKIDAVVAGTASTDPAARLASGLRLFVRLAHEDPAIGRFLVRYALTDEHLRTLLSGAPMKDLAEGIASGRYDVSESKALSVAGSSAVRRSVRWGWSSTATRAGVKPTARPPS